MDAVEARLINRMEDFPVSPWSESNFVPGEGPRDAKIIIIGEAPGKQENLKRRPFTGGAGTILDSELSRADIDRKKDVYVTNVVKYQPPGNNLKTKAALDYIAENIPILHREIRSLPQVRVIVPTGNIAMAALGLSDRIGRARGFIYNTPLGKVIPTFHPAYFMRSYEDIVTGIRDFQKIKRHATTGGRAAPREMFNIAPTIIEVEEFVARIKNQVNLGKKITLAVDLETYITDHPILTPIKTVGLATDNREALIVPFITQSERLYWRSEDETLRAITAIGELLDDPRIEIMCHNALFDILVLMSHGFVINGPIYDTMIGQYLVYHPSPHTLEYLVSIYTDFDQWKLSAGKADREFREYNARDCTVLHMCKPELDEDMDSNRVRNVFDILMDTIRPTCQMMLNGMHIDKERHKEIGTPLQGVLDKLRLEMEIESDTPGLNPNSPIQLQDVLFKKLKLKSQVKTKAGALSTGDDVLKRLSVRYPDNRFITLLRDYRKQSTRYKTFIKELRIDTDSRVRSQFSLHTVVTGRYSSSNPNLQNLPLRTDPEGYIRGMYTASPGYKIVTADYSQLELVIFAILSGDPEWIQAFKDGTDVHRLMGDGLIGKYEDKYRTFFKNFVYAFIYGSEGQEIEKVVPKELMLRGVNIQVMLANLTQTHPKMFEYREEIRDQMKTKHYIINAFGRKRWFVGHLSNKNFREGYNFRVQSTAGDIMHTRTIRLDEGLDLSVDRLILQLHDAFYFEVQDARADTVAGFLKSVMEERIITPLGYEFNLKADVEVGSSLAKKDLGKWEIAERII